VFIAVPIQEIFTRGGLQGLFEKFLPGNYRVFTSIVLSNLLFSTVHIYLSHHVGIMVFIGGLYIGWIYSRTHSLISSIVAHSLQGSWVLTVVGVAVGTPQ
jgi:membrane protease YdiL (CAAX protease family)